jgi:hypothetical protein
MAAVHDAAAHDPRTRFIFSEFSDPGIPCCWCDCPVEDHMGRGDDFACNKACGEEAVYLARTPGLPGSFPMCERHRWGHVELIEEVREMQGKAPLPIDVLEYDAYDADSDSSGPYEEADR